MQAIRGAVRISYDDPASLDAAFRGFRDDSRGGNSGRTAGFDVRSGKRCARSQRGGSREARRCKSSFWSAQRERTRNLPTATTAPRGRRRLWCALPACATRCCARRFCWARHRGLRRRLTRNASGQSQTDRRRPQFSAASLCGRPGAGRHRCRPTIRLRYNLTLDLVGPVSLPERELVERAARLLGRRSGSVRFRKDWLSVCWPFVNASAGPDFRWTLSR